MIITITDYLKMKDLKSFRYVIYCLFFAVIFVTVFSTSTSPLFNPPISTDSAVFQLIGKYWADGFLPYKDFWDHKGPIIYFVNFLGYNFSGNQFGVYIIQIISLFISILMAHFYLSHKYTIRQSLLLCFFILLSLSSNYADGNKTTEYLLPLLLVSFLFQYSWLENVIMNRQYEHRFLYSFVYGCTCAFAFLTRLSDIVGLICGVFYVYVLLMIKGKWRNLLGNCCFVLLGFIVVSLPFILYFYSKGILGEMWYGTIVFNLSYAQRMSNTGLSSEIGLWHLAIRHFNYINAYLLLCIGIWGLFISKTRKYISLFFCIIAIPTIIYFFKTAYAAAGYGQIAFPYLVLILLEVKALKNPRERNVVRKFLICLFLSFVFIKGMHNVYKVVNQMCSNKPNVECETFQQAVSLIPENEKDSFLAYNCHADTYLLYDIKPHGRFFTNQDWQISFNPNLRLKIQDSLIKTQPLWILVKPEQSFNLPIGIMSILEKEYELRSVLGNYYLYHHTIFQTHEE